MILEKQKEANILQQGESQDSIGMSLDLDSAQILMQMLSKNLYSDSIGSTIRECASNALDSHRRVGVDKPIVVSFSRNSSDNYEFSVEDFGIGLDADDVKNIISKYGKSTKRESNTELGMMGLGFKAPLAYSSSFYFVCRKDGIERKYMMYEGEDVNTIDLLYEQSTTEVNGVKVIVPVKWQDRSDFIKKINEQLAYFENVYFNVEGINNDFLIHRNDIFQFSELSKEDELHICLDNVYYPLDFIKLGIDRIRIPIGLKFSLTDGLFPTPNRESLRYTQESKQIILDKIAKLADYMIEKYNESITNSADIKTVFDYYSNYTKTVNVIGNGNWEIENLLKFSVLKVKEPKVDGIELLDLKLLHKNKDYIFGEYEVMYFLERDKMREAKNYWNRKLTASNADEKCYLFTGVLGGNKRTYMRETLNTKSYGSPTYSFVKKKADYELGDRSFTGMTTYFEILQLGLHPKTEWRQRITEFQSIQNMFISKMKNLDDIVIPKSWLDARKTVRTKGMSNSRVDDNGKRIIKLQGEIVGKIGVDLERYNDGRKCKFVPVTKKLNEVPREKNLIIYAHHDDYLKLDPLYEVMAKQPFKIMTFSSREMNILKDIEIHNLITYDKFMEGNNKQFKRIVTAHLIYNLVYKYKNTFNNMHKLKGVCTNLYDKLEKLDKYQRDNYTHSSPSVFEAMLTVAKEHNLFDHEIYHVYNEMKDVFEKLPFLNALMAYVGGYAGNAEVVDSIVDLMKYYKFKVNLDRYNLKLDEEITSELTEELIDELAN
jgi:hypothetical protein